MKNPENEPLVKKLYYGFSESGLSKQNTSKEFGPLSSQLYPEYSRIPGKIITIDGRKQKIVSEDEYQRYLFSISPEQYNQIKFDPPDYPYYVSSSPEVLPFYEIWWFWLIIVTVVLVIVLFMMMKR
jgi:hypothetical protein